MTEYVWVNTAQLQRELAKKAHCTCPACHTVWAHQDSLDWIREHFSSRTEPVECSECGARSVAKPGKYMGPRKLYVEPELEPVLTRTERQRKLGWFRRPLEPATPPKPKQKGAADDYEYQR